VPENEIVVEARLGTQKLAGDVAKASSIIEKIYGSGQAVGGERPASAASVGYVSPALLQGDLIAKAESKAKMEKYSGEPSGGLFGGLGGGSGGVNAGGTRTFQINRAVINIQQAKINTGASRSGSGQSSDSFDSSGLGGGLGGGYDHGAGGAGGGGAGGGVPVSGLAQLGSRFQMGFMQGEQAGNTLMSSSMTGWAHLGMKAIGMTYSYIQERRAKANEAQVAAPTAPVAAGASEESRTQARESNSRFTTAASAVPFIGAAMGAIMAAAQRAGEAHISYVTSQIGTLGQVGLMSAGGQGAIGSLGYSAAAKGHAIMQAQQHMNAGTFDSTVNWKGAGRESVFEKAAKFGHAQGLGAAGGMVMAAQLAEMMSVDSHGRSMSIGAGSDQLMKIASYGVGAGVGQRRLGQFAQGVIGIGQQQQLAGGVADTTAIASTMGAIAGHGASLATAQHATSTLSGMMSAGYQSGNPISGMLMLAAAQKGGSLDDIIKSAEKGITTEGKKDLASMLPPEMMKYVLMGQTGKLGEAEHLVTGIYKEGKSKSVTDSAMGYSEANQRVLAGANKFAFHLERLGQASENAATILNGLNGLLEKFAGGVNWLIGKLMLLSKK